MNVLFREFSKLEAANVRDEGKVGLHLQSKHTQTFTQNNFGSNTLLRRGLQALPLVDLYS